MGRKSKPSAGQVRTEQRQEEEYQKLTRIEEQKTRAAGRRTRGRASLISGSVGGIGSNDDFSLLNVATKEKLGTELAKRKRSDVFSINRNAQGKIATADGRTR